MGELEKKLFEEKAARNRLTMYVAVGSAAFLLVLFLASLDG